MNYDGQPQSNERNPDNLTSENFYPQNQSDLRQPDYQRDFREVGNKTINGTKEPIDQPSLNPGVLQHEIIPENPMSPVYGESSTPNIQSNAGDDTKNNLVEEVRETVEEFLRSSNPDDDISNLYNTIRGGTSTESGDSQ